MWPRGKIIEDTTVIGEEDEGLYKLNGQPEQALVHESIEPRELWYKRLTHVHYKALSIASKVVSGLRDI